MHDIYGDDLYIEADVRRTACAVAFVSMMYTTPACFVDVYNAFSPSTRKVGLSSSVVKINFTRRRRPVIRSLIHVSSGRSPSSPAARSRRGRANGFCPLGSSFLALAKSWSRPRPNMETSGAAAGNHQNRHADAGLADRKQLASQRRVLRWRRIGTARTSGHQYGYPVTDAA